MKILKADLDKMTRAVIELGTISAALLAGTKCPEPAIYEHVEEMVKDADKMRGDLGLEKVAPEELTSGVLSAAVTMAAHRGYYVDKGTRVSKDLGSMD